MRLKFSDGVGPLFAALSGSGVFTWDGAKLHLETRVCGMIDGQADRKLVPTAG